MKVLPVTSSASLMKTLIGCPSRSSNDNTMWSPSMRNQGRCGAGGCSCAGTAGASSASSRQAGVRKDGRDHACDGHLTPCPDVEECARSDMLLATDSAERET